MKEVINFKDWEKLDLRVALVIKAEEIENSDFLYKLTLDVGKEIGNRVVCAGIRKYYSKEDLEGRKVIVISNLEPRKLRGEESQGMVLASENSDGNVELISPGEKAEVGSIIR